MNKKINKMNNMIIKYKQIINNKTLNKYLLKCLIFNQKINVQS